MSYDKLNVKDLQDMCQKLGLPVGKKKPELLDILKAHYRGEENELFEDISILKIQAPAPIFGNEPIQLYYALTKIANIYSYLNSAVIYPLALEESTLYREENRQQDLFSRFPESIILSPNPFAGLVEDDVYIKIVGNGLPIEATNLPELYYTTAPIPLSRVVQLLFANEGKKNNFLSALKTFPDSNINSQLCAVLLPKQNETHPGLAGLTLPVTLAAYGQQHLEYFDKLLGMFAFMKNAAIFYADKEGTFQEYPNTFFSTLQLMNPAALAGGYKENPLIRYLLFPAQMDVNSVQRFIFKLVIDNILGNAVFDHALAADILNAALASKVIKPEEKKRPDLYPAKNDLTK